MLNKEVYQLIVKISGTKNKKGIDDIITRCAPKKGEEPTISEKLDYMKNLFPGIQITESVSSLSKADAVQVYDKYLFYLSEFKFDELVEE